jgi:predicted TIM-barrel fold metal-dependent hydrolase
MADAAPWRVDVHHHFYPSAYREAMIKGGSAADATAFPGVRDWTEARTVEEMDRHGVATSILSLSPPGCRLLDAEGNRKLARVCNEHATQMARDYPGRFGLFSVLPMPDVEASLAELAYAMDVLKADGVQLMTSYGDKWCGDPAYEALFAELNRRKALVFIHPLAPTCCANLIEWVPPALLEYPQDTNRCIMSLMFSGTLSRYPDIRYIFCHGGGAMPMLSGRVMHSGSNRKFLDKVPKGIDYELKKLHYDVALAAFRPSLSALFAMVPATQVLLGSDYPFGSIGTSVGGLDEFGLPLEQARAIYRGNAERLIPRLSAGRKDASLRP